jgi:hypothetical protein
VDKRYEVSQMSGIAIKYTDPSQEGEALQKVASEVAAILTAGEEILYIALQNKTAVTLKKDAAVASTNRLIFYRAGMLGRVSFADYQWQDITNVQMKQGFLASNLVVSLASGAIDSLSGLDKEQTKRLYGIAQQMEQEWRERRRIRQMEEDRARAGGIIMAAPQPNTAAPPPQAEDPVAKLGKAKAMLDQGLIDQAEYDTLKARILSSM